MKIRNGWVGNSSSSSFIINANTADMSDQYMVAQGEYINLESFFENYVISNYTYKNVSKINWVSDEEFFKLFMDGYIIDEFLIPKSFEETYNKLSKYNNMNLKWNTPEFKTYLNILRKGSVELANIIRKFKTDIDLFSFEMSDHYSGIYGDDVIDDCDEWYWKEHVYDLGSDIVYVINEH